MGAMLYNIIASVVASLGIVYLAIRIFDAIRGRRQEKEGYTRHKIIYFIFLIVVLAEMVHEKVSRIIEYYTG